MRLAVVHGYFLHDSGSGIYVRELTRALVQLGHDVTLICQERAYEKYDFIDAAYVLGSDNLAMECTYRRDRRYRGSCALVRPNLDGELLVYVEGPFQGFERSKVVAFQDAPQERIDRYISANMQALRSTFSKWAPECVLAQHLVMQPFIVRAALDGTTPYILTCHGSALNFSVRRCAALVPYARSGLEGCAAAVTVSPGARNDLVDWATDHGLDIAEKTVALPPGIDTAVFRVAPDRETAIAGLRAACDVPSDLNLKANDDVVAFAGPLRATKGVQHIVAAMPLIRRSRGRRQRLLVAGDGPACRGLEELSSLVDTGQWARARRLVADDPELQSPEAYGSVVLQAESQPEGRHAAFLGHLDHEALASVFALADVVVVPSIFPEAAALVSIEALSSGALPLAAYHSGMVTLCDLLAASLDDETFVSLTLGADLTSRLATALARLLDRYPTRDGTFRSQLHDLAATHYPPWTDTAAAYVGLLHRSGADWHPARM